MANYPKVTKELCMRCIYGYQWAYELRYFPRDLMNATIIFQHVASSIGIHAGRIDEEKAVEFGQRLRQLVIDMTGYDPQQFWKDPKNFETHEQA